MPDRKDTGRRNREERWRKKKRALTADAGNAHARTVIVTTDDVEMVPLATKKAREKNVKAHIVVPCYLDDFAEILDTLGAKEVISSSKSAFEGIAPRLAGNDAVTDVAKARHRVIWRGSTMGYFEDGECQCSLVQGAMVPCQGRPKCFHRAGARATAPVDAAPRFGSSLLDHLELLTKFPGWARASDRGLV